VIHTVDMAIDMLVPIVGALFLGMWLQNRFGLSPLWTVSLAIFGMIAGLRITYMRLETKRKQDEIDHPKVKEPEKPFNPRPWEDDDKDNDDDDHNT